VIKKSNYEKGVLLPSPERVSIPVNTDVKYDYSLPIFNIADIEMVTSRWTLWIKINLFFVKMRVVDSVDIGNNYRLKYKLLRGKMYVYDFSKLPPIHHNCRCATRSI
jgi:hypothetical protein